MTCFRPIRFSLAAARLAAAALAMSFTACSTGGGGDDANASQDQVALAELSTRLEADTGHSYTAEYLVEGTQTVVIVAVDPESERAAVSVGDEAELWTSEGSEPLTAWLSEHLAGILPTDEEVAAWLIATSEDPSAAAEFSDTTLAGQLSDCADVRGASESPVGAFTVCVTTVGVIASVSADVEDAAYTAKLVNYRDGVDTTWLDGLSNESSGDA